MKENSMKESNPSILEEIEAQTLRLAGFVKGQTEVQILAIHRRTPGEPYRVSYSAQVGDVPSTIQFPRESETGETPTEAVDNLIARLSQTDYGSEERAKIAERIKELGFRVTRY